jgi:cysteine desulfurase family protein
VTVYLDHGATSWPKPASVLEAMESALRECGGNPGRGAHHLALESSRMVHEARRSVAEFLGVPNARDLLFQPNCTQALNLVLSGLLRPGDRVVTTSVEHNAVARPLRALESRGVGVEIVPTGPAGLVEPSAIKQAINAEPTRAIVCQHAGNLTGAIQPVAEIAEIAHAAGVLLIVDGAQAGGHLPIDLGALGADAWACSGHKGLLGPQGLGVLYLAPGCDPEPLVLGGTGGGSSAEATMPRERPDRYEAGTPNTPGIAGLGAAIRFLVEHAEDIRATEQRLAAKLHEGILGIRGFRVLGPEPGVPRVPIVAAVHESLDSASLASALDERWGIAVRAGLHCAPWAHASMGTLQTGALRFGLGFGTTGSDVDLAVSALEELARVPS